MSELQLANVLQLSVVAIFWLIVIFKMIPEVRLDSFRQGMFTVRDEMFDYAAEGNISFEHPAYVLLRRQLNGYIRFAHDLTVFRILMRVAAHKIRGEQQSSIWHADWEKAIQSIHNSDVENQLRNFHHRALMLAVKRLLFGSPVLWVMTMIFVVQLLFQGAAKGAGQLVKAASKKVFTGPINDRSIEEVAAGAAA